MSALTFKLLGQFECLLPSGTSLALQTRKAEMLLAYLALNPDAPHARDKLTNLLWSDRSEEQARNSLRQALSTIKKLLTTLNPLPLTIDRTTVMLDRSLIYVDGHEFEQLAATSDIESLSKAKELYRGEFLEGITIHNTTSEEWLFHERDRFKRLIVEVLTNLNELQISSNDYKSVIETTEHLVKLDPFYEAGWRALMWAYHINGDRNHALLAFKRCRSILQKELGVEPELKTSHLKESIKRGQNLSIGMISNSAIENGLSSQELEINHSILVLPFNNLSGDPKQEYFCDGITESIVFNLGLCNGVIVKSRYSSFAFKGSFKPISEIAEELEVKYIVEGSIRKRRDKIIITVTLIESQSGNQIWGKRYDSETKDIFDLEQQLSQTIAGTINGRLGQELQHQAIRKPAKDLRSYDYLMRGNYHLYQFTKKDLSIAKEEYQKCLEIDPNCADAHNALTCVFGIQRMENWTAERNTALELVGYHIKKALELEPNDAGIHANYVDFLMISRKFSRAGFHADKSIELNPTIPEGYAVKAWYLGATRQYKESLKYAEICKRIDPYHPWAFWAAAEVYRLNEEYEQAIDTFRSLSHPPTNVYAQMAACYAGLGLMDHAREEMNNYHELASKQMFYYPSTVEQWYALWYDAFPYEHDEDFEKFFNLLLQAGLCDSDMASAKTA